MIDEHSNSVNLWDFDGKRLRTHFQLGVTFNKMKWSPDGAYLALSSDKYATLTFEYRLFLELKKYTLWKSPLGKVRNGL